MDILTEITDLCRTLSLPVATSIWLEAPAPDCYAVITPLTESYALWGDDRPGVNIEEARISLYTRGDYTETAKQLGEACLERGLTVTGRTYVGFETDTKYHHWAIDLADFDSEAA